MICILSCAQRLLRLSSRCVDNLLSPYLKARQPSPESCLSCFVKATALLGELLPQPSWHAEGNPTAAPFRPELQYPSVALSTLALLHFVLVTLDIGAVSVSPYALASMLLAKRLHDVIGVSTGSARSGARTPLSTLTPRQCPVCWLDDRVPVLHHRPPGASRVSLLNLFLSPPAFFFLTVYLAA
jgi:hypothetical protein